jgi:hypothetical protein
MADDSKSSIKVPIIVAIIGLVGTLTTVIINKWSSGNTINTNAAAIHCIVTGSVYNADENNAPMPAFPIGYTTNNSFHRITLTGADGKFTADFSSLPANQFPLTLFVKFNRLNIATKYQINQNGGDGLNIYISPKTITARHSIQGPLHHASTDQISK